jgi:hypothetical protein
MTRHTSPSGQQSSSRPCWVPDSSRQALRCVPFGQHTANRCPSALPSPPGRIQRSPSVQHKSSHVRSSEQHVGAPSPPRVQLLPSGQHMPSRHLLNSQPHARSVGQHTADPSSLTQTSPSSQHRVHPPAGSAQQRTRGMQVGGSRSQRGLSSGAQVRQLPSALQQPGVGPTSHGPHSPCCWQRPQGPQFGSHTPVSGLQLVHDNGSQLSMHVPSAVQNSHAVQQLVASLPVQEVCPGRQPAGSQAQESWSSTCPAGQPRQRPSQQASPSLQQTVPHSSRSELSGAAGPHRAQGPLPLAASLMQLPRALPGGNTRVHQWAHSALLAVTGCGSIAAAKPPSKVPQRPRNSPRRDSPSDAMVRARSSKRSICITAPQRPLYQVPVLAAIIARDYSRSVSSRATSASRRGSRICSRGSLGAVLPSKRQGTHFCKLRIVSSLTRVVWSSRSRAARSRVPHAAASRQAKGPPCFLNRSWGIFICDADGGGPVWTLLQCGAS